MRFQLSFCNVDFFRFWLISFEMSQLKSNELPLVVCSSQSESKFKSTKSEKHFLFCSKNEEKENSKNKNPCRKRLILNVILCTETHSRWNSTLRTTIYYRYLSNSKCQIDEYVIFISTMNSHWVRSDRARAGVVYSFIESFCDLAHSNDLEGKKAIDLQK